MGRPKCTQEVIEMAVKCKKNGMSNKDIAAYIGISERAFYKWVSTPKTDNQVQLVQSLKAAEVEHKAALRSRIMQASDKSWQAAAWILERQYPDEFARPEVQLAKKAAQEAVEEALGSVRDVIVKVAEAAGNAADVDQ